MRMDRLVYIIQLVMNIRQVLRNIAWSNMEGAVAKRTESS